MFFFQKQIEKKDSSKKTFLPSYSGGARGGQKKNLNTIIRRVGIGWLGFLGVFSLKKNPRSGSGRVNGGFLLKKNPQSENLIKIKKPEQN